MTKSPSDDVRTTMLRCATSHDFCTQKMISITKRVPVPKDKSPKTDVVNNSLLLNSTYDISDMRLE